MKKPIMEKSIMEKTAIGNITTVEKTAIEKTRTKITAKITATALLFFLALFTLTTCLIAQAVQNNSKSGFFAGFVYLQGFQVDSNKSISESTVTTSYEVTGYSGATTRIDATGGIPSRSDIVGIRALFSANCETGAASIDINGAYYFDTDSYESFSPGRKPTAEQIANGDATVTITDPEGNLFPSGRGVGETSHCYRHFYGDLSTDRVKNFNFEVYSVSTMDSPQIIPASSSTESDKLSGIGLQFGYRWEKWRASFTHYQGQGGDNELTNSLVIADYFFQEKFFVGAGLASIKLTNSSSGNSLSASATSPVLQVGYAEKLTSNLQLSIGVLQYSSGLSLSSTTTTPTTTPTIADFSDTQTATNVGDSATIGIIGVKITGSSVNLLYNVGGNDDRVEVTQVGERTVNIEETVTPAGGETTIEAELKAPTVISISLHLSF